MKEKSSENRKKEYIYTIISAMIAAGLIIFSVVKAQGIFFPTDEFGYWERAAAFLGTDWTGVTGGATNYARGYSTLLIPIMALSKNAVMMYRIALVVNALLAVLSSYLFISLIKVMYGRITVWVLPCITFPAYMVYMSYTISEVLLYVLFLLLCHVMIRISAGKQSPWLFASGLLLSAVMTFVHYRAVGIAAIFVLVCLMSISKDTLSDKKTTLISVGVLLALLIATILYSLSGGRISAKVFSPVLVTDILTGSVGKVFYLGASTFGLGIVGLSAVFRKRSVLFDLFILLSFSYMVVLASFYFGNGLRLDQPVYGRYGEMFIPLLLYIGAMELIDGEDRRSSDKRSLWMRIGIFMGGTAVMLTLYVTLTGKTEYVADFVNGIDWMYGKGMPKISAVYVLPAAITLAVYFVLEFFMKQKKRRNTCAILLACLFIILSVFLSWKHVWRFQDMDQSDRLLAESAMKTADGGKEVIFLDSPYNDYVNLLQFWFMDKGIRMMEGLDPEAFKTPRDAVVITYKNYERDDQLTGRYSDRRSSSHFEMYSNTSR